MSKDDDNTEITLLNEANGGEMNTEITYQRIELWEQVQSTPTMDSTIRGCSASRIHVKK